MLFCRRCCCCLRVLICGFMRRSALLLWWWTTVIVASLLVKLLLLLLPLFSLSVTKSAFLSRVCVGVVFLVRISSIVTHTLPMLYLYIALSFLVISFSLLRIWEYVIGRGYSLELLLIFLLTMIGSSRTGCIWMVFFGQCIESQLNFICCGRVCNPQPLVIVHLQIKFSSAIIAAKLSLHNDIVSLLRL